MPNRRRQPHSGRVGEEEIPVTARGKILFVDDEKRVLNSMRGLFRRDYELFLTTDGAEAIKLVSDNDVDVIVADQRMPGLSGVEVLGKVREVSPRTVRILLTGYADPEAIEGSINVGEVFRFLSKPCQPKLLRETVQLAIAAARATRDAARATVTPTRTTPVTDPEPATPPAAPATDSTGAFRQPSAAQSTSTIRPHAGQPTDSTSAIRRAAGAHPEGSTSAIRRPPEVQHTDSTSAIRRRPGDFQRSEPPAQQTISPPTLGEPVAPAAASPTPRPEPESRRREDTLSTPPESLGREPEPPTEQQRAEHWQDRTEIVMSGETSREIRRLDLPVDFNANMRSVGVAVFTVNPAFAEAAMRTISSERTATLATTLIKVAEVLEQREAGVLLTDFTSDTGLLQNMIAALKKHLPELVTIVVSENRDTTDMINLINYGQVFRYVEKPVDSTTLRMDINAAVMKHLQLLEHPELNQRHEVVNMAAAPSGSPTLNQFIGKVTGIRGRWANSSDKSH